MIYKMIMIYDMVLMTSRRGMIIHIFLYNDLHKDFYLGFASFTRIITGFTSFTHVITGFTGFTRIIRWWLRSYEAHMDRPRERSHMGLIYIVMCPHRGWCSWHFNYDGFRAKWGFHDSSHGLPRPTLMSGSVYDIWWFYNIKAYMYYVLKVYMYYGKKHWWSLAKF